MSEEMMETGHYCPDWDGMFIRPGDPEMDCCACQVGMAETTNIPIALSPPTLHSGTDWHVGAATLGGDTEIRIVLRSTAEAKAWIAWLFDNCGTPDPVEMERNNV